jgi:hypothetical protein
MAFESYSDSELADRAALARQMMHEAPRSLPGKYGDAWARWSAEWGAIRREQKRRESENEPK